MITHIDSCDECKTLDRICDKAEPLCLELLKARMLTRLVFGEEPSISSPE